MATFVLVHGAWHGGWCYKRVAQRLRQAGHEVYTPTLTGVGERVHLVNRRDQPRHARAGYPWRDPLRGAFRLRALRPFVWRHGDFGRGGKNPGEDPFARLPRRLRASQRPFASRHGARRDAGRKMRDDARHNGERALSGDTFVSGEPFNVIREGRRRGWMPGSLREASAACLREELRLQTEPRVRPRRTYVLATGYGRRQRDLCSLDR